MATLIGTTVPGLEAEAAALLRRVHGLVAEASLDGAVHVRVPGDLDAPGASHVAVRLNRQCRCLRRIGLLLTEGDLERLEDCYRLTRSVDLEPLLRREPSFAVRPLRRGSHGFRSPDVGREVGQAVIDRHREDTGVRLRVDLDDPDVILRAEVHHERFRLWLDTTGDETLSSRSYRRRHHPAGLDPCLARLMLEVGGWRDESVLDPMCGSGTIPVEAALVRLGVPAWRLRPGGWAWERLPGTTGDPAVLGAESGGPAERETPESAAGAAVPEVPRKAGGDRPMLGIEISPKHVQTAWETVAAAGVTRHVRIVQGDATELGGMVDPAGSYPLAVLNPPFGRRMGSPRKVERLYRAFCAAARDAGVERLVILVELVELLEEALAAAGYERWRRIPIRQGDLDVKILYAGLPGAPGRTARGRGRPEIG